MNSLVLGDRVEDQVTKIKGIATGRCVYLNGCVQIEITPPCKKGGEAVTSRWVDIGQIKVLTSNPLKLTIPTVAGAPDWIGEEIETTPTSPSVEIRPRRSGGPQSSPTGMGHP